MSLYRDSMDGDGTLVPRIKEWKELLSQVSDNQSLRSSLLDSRYFAPFKDQVDKFEEKLSRISSKEPAVLAPPKMRSMTSSRFYPPFAAKVEHWEKTLANISEVTDMIQQVQRAWRYLENIFVGSEDIRPHLPLESIMFDEVNAGFIDIMDWAFRDPLAVKACAQPNMLEVLTGFLEKLEKIQKSLDDYLEKKRQFFPRFYFLSNDDLLEILGQAKDPDQVQKHLKKCFEGIKTMDLVAPSKEKGQKTWEAVGMNSPDGEKVKFIKPVPLEPPVEGWLLVMERRMRESLRKILNTCHQANVMPKGMKKEKWVKEYPGQLLITSGQIAWTTDTHNALVAVEKGKKKALKMLKKAQTKYLIIMRQVGQAFPRHFIRDEVKRKMKMN